jgi:hypothetical protein
VALRKAMRRLTSSSCFATSTSQEPNTSAAVISSTCGRGERRRRDLQSQVHRAEHSANMLRLDLDEMRVENAQLHEELQVGSVEFFRTNVGEYSPRP